MAWGWPYALYGDEALYMPNALRMAADGSLNPGAFHNSHLFTYLCFLEVGLSYVTGRVVGLWNDSATFGRFVWAHSIIFALAARLTIASIAIATIALVHQTTSRLFGTWTAVAAALFLAVSPLHTLYSKIAVNDLCMVFFVTLVIYICSSRFECSSLLSAVMTGFTSGLAIGSKYNGGLVLAVPGALILLGFYRRRNDADSSRTSLAVAAIARLCVLLFAAGAGFLLTNPYSVIDSKAFVEGFTRQVGYGRHPWPGQPSAPVPFLMMQSLYDGYGLVPALLALVGAAAMARTHRSAAVPLLVFPVAYVLFMASQSLFFDRFLLPVYPTLAICSAYGILVLFGRSPFRAAIATGLAVSLPLMTTVALNRVLSRTDTRLQLREWVAKNLPTGAKVLGDYDATAALGESLDGALPIDLTAQNRTELVKAWDCDRLRTAGIQYVVLSSSVTSGLARSDLAYGEAFLACVNQQASIIATLSPFPPSAPTRDQHFDAGDLLRSLSHRTRGGFPIRVYRVNQE